MVFLCCHVQRGEAGCGLCVGLRPRSKKSLRHRLLASQTCYVKCCVSWKSITRFSFCCCRFVTLSKDNLLLITEWPSIGYWVVSSRYVPSNTFIFPSIKMTKRKQKLSPPFFVAESTTAPLLRSSSTTEMWPSLAARCRALSPFWNKKTPGLLREKNRRNSFLQPGNSFLLES